MIEELKQKTVTGVKWSGMTMFVVTGLVFIITAVLARLLSPYDFGLMGMLMVIINFVILFADFGLPTAIIQQQELNDEQLSTIFFLSVVIGLFLSATCYFLSGLIAQFFQKPELIYLSKVVSVSFVITSFGQVFRALLQKKMDFKALFGIDVLSNVIYGIFSILLAFRGFGVLSLVYGFLLRQLAGTIFSFRLNSFKPRLKFNIKSIRNLLHFGGYVLGERIVNYFNRNLDYIIIGRILGAEALGYYTLAYQIMLLPISRISGSVTQVIFPAFASIQDDNSKIREGYLKVIRYISLVTFPVMAILFIVASEFIPAVFGSKWNPTILVLKILCLIGAIQSIGTIIGSVLYAKGRPDIGFKWNCFGIGCYGTAFLIGVRWGIVGVASMYAVFAVVLFPIIQNITNNLIDLRWRDLMKQLKVQILGSFLSIAVTTILRVVFLNQNHFTQNFILISSVMSGLIVYSIFIYLIDRKVITEGLVILGMNCSRNSTEMK